MIVTQQDCSPEAWALLGQQSDTIARLRDELTGAYKRLCRYEGHLPIHDSGGTMWCELCNEKIESASRWQRFVRWLARRAA